MLLCTYDDLIKSLLQGEELLFYPAAPSVIDVEFHVLFLVVLGDLK